MAVVTYDSSFKIILAGDTNVGKTSVLLHFIGELELGTSGQPATTIGVDYFRKKVTLTNGRVILLQLWDINGSEAFRNFVLPYFINGSAIIFFDVSDETSFENAINCWNSIAIKTCIAGKPTLGLVGTKSDLVEKREVSQERAHIVADELGLRYFEVNRSNVNQIFMTLAKELDDEPLSVYRQ